MEPHPLNPKFWTARAALSNALLKNPDLTLDQARKIAYDIYGPEGINLFDVVELCLA